MESVSLATGFVWLNASEAGAFGANSHRRKIESKNGSDTIAI